MSKILSISFTTTAPASGLQHLASILRAAVSKFGRHSAAAGRPLSNRLRYDLGELDINPDCIRGVHLSDHAGVDREMMRRSF